jgi:ERCC4-type nuclease
LNIIVSAGLVKCGPLALDEIEGIGPARKKKLLSHFGSVKAIQQASLEELIRIPGMNRSAAENVYKNFHGDERQMSRDDT